MSKAMQLLVSCAMLFISVSAAYAEVPDEESAQISSAMVILNHYISEGSQDPTAYELRGDAFKALGDFIHANRDYQKAIELRQHLTEENHKHLSSKVLVKASVR